MKRFIKILSGLLIIMSVFFNLSFQNRHIEIKKNSATASIGNWTCYFTYKKNGGWSAIICDSCQRLDNIKRLKDPGNCSPHAE